jgi:hypothetical protein
MCLALAAAGLVDQFFRGINTSADIISVILGH